jgi:hypothetical protein
VCRVTILVQIGKPIWCVTTTADVPLYALMDGCPRAPNHA